MKCFIYLIIWILTSLLSSCASYPRLINLPFDSGGQSLNSPAAELTPQISGRYIAFSSDRRGTEDIYLFDLETKNLIDLPGLNSLDTLATHPSVDADGRHIVFTANRQGRTSIYIYDRETRQSRNLTANLLAEVRNPTISADGSRIAFESNAGGHWEILVYNQNGELLNR